MAGYEPLQGGKLGLEGLKWGTPSEADVQRATKELLSSLDDPAEPVPLWEAELQRVVAQHAQLAAAAGALQGRGKISVQSEPRPVTYTLRLAKRQTAVLATTAGVVGAVYDRPSTSSKFLGTDTRTTIEVVEVRDGWLRFSPQPDDSCECWIQERSADGVWEVAAQTPASRSTEFAIRTGLRMLRLFLDRDEGACEMMMAATSDFLEDLCPMSLFNSSGQANGEGIDRVLTMLTDWLMARSVAGLDGAAEMLTRLAVTRGSLPEILCLAQLFGNRPSLMTAAVVTELQKLSEVDSFDPAVAHFFAPRPGSSAELVALWNTSVFSLIRKEKARSRNTEEVNSAIAKARAALVDGDESTARLIVAAQLSEKSFATVRMPTMEKTAASDAAVSYRETLRTLEVTARQQEKEPSSVTALAMLFGHVDLAMQRLVRRGATSTIGSHTEQCHPPIGVDPQSCAKIAENLVANGSLAVLLHPSAVSERTTVMSLLRLLVLNFEAAKTPPTASAESRDPEVYTEVYTLLRNYLVVDLNAHPELATIANEAASCLAAGATHLIWSSKMCAELLVDLSQQLVAANIAPPSGQFLQPADGWRAHSSISAEPGGVYSHSAVKSATTPSMTAGNLTAAVTAHFGRKGKLTMVLSKSEMATGLHFLEAECSSSDVSNCQGWQGFSFGVARVDATLDSVLETYQRSGAEGRLFQPLLGVSLPEAGTSTVGVESHFEQVMWTGKECFNAQSMAADDLCGLLFDADAGLLYVYKNGRATGVVFSGLRQPFVFAVAIGEGVSVKLSITQLPAHQIDALRLDARPRAALGNASVFAQVCKSLLQAFSEPSRLQSLFAEGSDVDTSAVVQSVLALQMKTIRSWHLSTPDLSSLQRRSNYWRWGKRHEHVGISADRLSARCTDGSNPDYVGVLGSEEFTEGVHTFKVRINGDTNGYWIGVTTPDMTLGGRPPGSSSSHGKAAWLHVSSGNFSQRNERKG